MFFFSLLVRIYCLYPLAYPLLDYAVVAACKSRRGVLLYIYTIYLIVHACVNAKNVCRVCMVGLCFVGVVFWCDWCVVERTLNKNYLMPRESLFGHVRRDAKTARGRE